MRNVILFLFTVCVIASVSPARIISDTYEYDVRLENTDYLLVTGGGVDQIIAFDNSRIDVQDTNIPLLLDIGGIWGIVLNNNSKLDFQGGEIGDVTLHSNSEAVLQGGSIGYIISNQYILQPNQEILRHIEIICREYDDSNPNFITGIWDVDNNGDGEFDTFAINLVDQTGYDPVIDNIEFTIIPEPATLLLLGIGGFLIRKKI